MTAAVPEPVLGAGELGWLNQPVDPAVVRLTVGQFQAAFPAPAPRWRIGPFQRDDAMTFRQPADWTDPTGQGWRNGYIFNPSVIVAGDELHLIYRASPAKESLGSRLGHAVYVPETGWTDDPANPIVYPTLGNEVLGVEDPKVYRRDDGRYVLFYNAIWGSEASLEESRLLAGTPLPGIGCDVMVAISDDLRTWQKLGLAVPREVSQGWAKGAVIPRTPAGDAVRIAGEYLMYLSEGCGGHQTVGRSSDLVTWTFEQRDYLDLTGLGGKLTEVAFASVGHDGGGRVPTTQPTEVAFASVGNGGDDLDLTGLGEKLTEGHGDDLVLDFFYRGPQDELAAGQARYRLSDPLTACEVGPGGVLAWGGLARWQGDLWFAQGWDAPEGSRELYFYRTGQR